MLSRLSVYLLLPLLALVCASDYAEQLLLRPLPQGALLASFNFRSNASQTSFDQQNFRYFPRSLGQILQHTSTKELHIRFSLGRWDAENWGHRPWNGAREGGTGVELWAWVEADGEEEADKRWLALTNALSGLFCASLNFIDSTRTIRPVMTFDPEGSIPSETLDNLHLLHGTLPHEVVCTENLTPFLKLLPCKGKAGISSLLDGHKLFDASWQTMSIDVRPVCPEDGGECILEMEQTVDMVLDIDRSRRPQGNPIPRPKPIEEIKCDESKHYNSHDSCMPIASTTEPEWSLEDIFGRSIKGSCALSDSADAARTVCIVTRAHSEQGTVPVGTNDGPEALHCIALHTESEPGLQEEELIKVWDSAGSDDLGKPAARAVRAVNDTGLQTNVVFPEQHIEPFITNDEPAVHASRSITGHGAERGGILAVIRNTSPSPITIVYLESLPWFMKPYLHTLSVSTADTESGTPYPAGKAFDALKETYFRPAIDRKRGTHLELLLELPPLSTTTLSYDFEKAILRYTEYPPDANRGFDAAPAVIRVLPGPYDVLDDRGRQRGQYLRTTDVLLALPTPDFSMPYNVIILTSTVMALGFGSIFNLLVRRFVAADEVEASKLGGRIRELRDRLRLKLRSLLAKGSEKEKKTQ